MALALQGCIAAAAVPVLAGGAIARSELDNNDAPDDPAQQTQNTAEQSNLPAKPVANRPANPPEDEEWDIAQLNQAIAQAASEPASEPALGDNANNAQLQPNEPVGNFGPYQPLSEYLKQSADQLRAGEAVSSALLSNPGSLDGQRQQCKDADKLPAIMIDLDAGQNLLVTPIQQPTPHNLAPVLAQLRADKIQIAWVSGQTADKAGALRRLLAGSGLDPAGQDELLLMRYGKDRKQTRRNEFAAQHCLLAIIGSENADFDELFLYIKDVSSAGKLQPLYGDGWFLYEPVFPPAVAQ